MNINFLVRVSCMTFNHAPYIEDAMNGFCMQETTFPFVCTIVDDASTDGEQEVIKKYLQEHFDLEDSSVVRNEETDDYVLTFARHKTNKNCYFAVLYLKYNHYSIKKTKMPYIKEWQDQARYIAMCEGDDYWIHKGKLQMQVDFLEKNEDYSFSHTNFLQSNSRGTKIWSSEKRENTILNYGEHVKPEDLLVDYRVMTLTVVMRRDIVDKSKKCDTFLFSRYFLMGDTQLWYSLSLQGKVHYSSEYCAVYRHSENSVTRQKNKQNYYRFRLSSAELRMYLSQRDNFSSNYSAKFRKKYNNYLFLYMAFDNNFNPLYPLDINQVNWIIRLLKKLHLLKIYLCLFDTRGLRV